MAEAPQHGDAAAPTLQAAFLDEVARATGAAPDEVRAMAEAVRRGEDCAEYFGLTPAIQASLENCAVAYYRGKRYQEALQSFEALIYLTQGQRATAWRGAGACHQALHAYEEAVRAYANALVISEHDTLSAAHCGECLFLLGRREEGLHLLQALLDYAPASEAKSAHMLRAKALVAAAAKAAPAAGAANKVATSHAAAGPTRTPAQAEASAKLQALDAQLGERAGAQAATTRHAPADDAEQQANLQAIADAVLDKALTIRMLADFSDEQMDAGYAVACQHLERDEVLQALQVCLTMLYLDSRDVRFYQLAGLCAHHLTLFCLADYFYSLAEIWGTGGPDPATLIYRGEAKMLSDEAAAGMAMVRQGIALGRKNPAMAELVRRGEALLKQGAAMGQGGPAATGGAG